MLKPANQTQQAPYAYWASILIPVYNEESTLPFILNKVRLALGKESFELVVVDDGSTDNSAQLIQDFAALHPELPLQYIHQKNQGKGAAIRTAMAAAAGEVYVVQDADLEYDPLDILPLLELFKKGEQVVYGSRNLDPANRAHSTLMFYYGGLLVTWFTNFLFGSKLTDEATCYKLFRAELFESLSFRNNDFAWEPEITAKILKLNIQIAERPVSYHPRAVEEGKKISWRDGMKALYVLFYEFIKR